MSWFSKVIAHHPVVLLIAISVFSSTCLIIPLTTLSLPNFRDPQLGFETRGTLIAKRINAWDHLMNAQQRSSGPLTVNPILTSDLLANEKLNFKLNSSLNRTDPDEDFIDTRWKNESTLTNVTKVIIVGKHNVTTEESDDDDEDWEDIKHEGHHHDHQHLSKDNFFCSEPLNNYGRVVLSGENLFTLDSVLSMCLIEAMLVSNEHYGEICENITSVKCCRPWSLPNYIAMLHNRTSCLNITKTDVGRTRRLIQDCRSYFNMDSLPKFPLKEIPNRCKKFDAVYNLLHFILDIDYVNSSMNLKNVLIILPIAQSSAALPYYKSFDIESLKLNNIAVTAIEFGLKNMLFDDYLLKDTYLIALGGVFVFLSLWFYTRSFFLTIMTLLAIIFSLSIAYFVYTLMFEIKFFPFMNLLVIIVAIGVGGDASLIMVKGWWIARKEHPHVSIAKLLLITNHHSFLTLLVSSLTTASAFFSSFVSNISAIRCFSVFAGNVVLANFVVMVGWLPSCLVISGVHVDRFTSSIACTLANAVVRLRFVWLALFSSITMLAFTVILYKPGLRLPDSAQMQLFRANHPFEQYDLIYRQHFWCEKLQRTSDDESGFHMPLRWVWGVVDLDNGNHLDPSSKGTLRLDSSFDLAAPESQVWLLNLCSTIRRQKWYEPTLGPLVPNCFIEAFVSWMKRKCVDNVDSLSREPCCESAKFPFSRRVFSLCLAQAARSLQATTILNPQNIPAGPKFANIRPTNSSRKTHIPKIKALVIEYDSNYTFSTSYYKMKEFFDQVELWTTEELKSAPPGLQKGWFISNLKLFDVQASLRRDTGIAAVAATCFALIIVWAATRDCILAVFASLTVTSTIATTVASLVLLGWRLNVLESVCITVAIGLAVDFTLHYTIAYKLSRGGSRKNRVKDTIQRMAGPTAMSCLTSCLAGAAMLPSMVLAYTQVGVFLLTLMPLSWAYSTLWLCSILSVAGREGQPSPGSVELRPRARHPDHSPSAASATTVIHDDDIIHLELVT